MWQRLGTGLLSAAVLIAIPALSYAGVATATVTYVHGINGTDLSQSESLPLDIEVDNALAFAGVTFRSFSLQSLAAGDHLVEISLADPQNPGSNPTLASANISVLGGLDYSVLFGQVDGQLALLEFFNDLAPVAGGNSFRLTVRHGAIAPTIDAYSYPVRPTIALLVPEVENGTQGGPADFPVRPHVYNLTIQDFETGDVLVTPIQYIGVRRKCFLIYLVGSQTNGTLEVLIETREAQR